MNLTACITMNHTTLDSKHLFFFILQADPLAPSGRSRVGLSSDS